MTLLPPEMAIMKIYASFLPWDGRPCTQVLCFPYQNELVCASNHWRFNSFEVYVYYKLWRIVWICDVNSNFSVRLNCSFDTRSGILEALNVWRPLASWFSIMVQISQFRHYWKLYLKYTRCIMHCWSLKEFSALCRPTVYVPSSMTDVGAQALLNGMFWILWHWVP